MYTRIYSNFEVREIISAQKFSNRKIVENRETIYFDIFF